MKTIQMLADPLLLKKDLNQAVDLLKKGRVIGIPTETVYGLAADLFQEKAISEIFRIKKRPSGKPLIALVSELHQLEQFTLPPSKLFFRLAELFWPGPLTLVIPRRPGVASLAAANLPTIGVRMTPHPCTRQLIHAFEAPLAAPSANFSGFPNPHSAQDVFESFNGTIPAIIDAGPAPYGVPSTILSLEEEGKPLLLRAGSIPKETIEEALQIVIREH